MSNPCVCEAPAAEVDISILNNATWQDAFQFDDADDTTWNLVGQSFIMEIKGSRDDAAALLELKSVDSEIIVDDTTLRVIHMNVPYTAIRAALPVGEYVYDLVMYDGASPPVRVVLMFGALCVQLGISET